MYGHIVLYIRTYVRMCIPVSVHVHSFRSGRLRKQTQEVKEVNHNGRNSKQFMVGDTYVRTYVNEWVVRVTVESQTLKMVPKKWYVRSYRLGDLAYIRTYIHNVMQGKVRTYLVECSQHAHAITCNTYKVEIVNFEEVSHACCGNTISRLCQQFQPQVIVNCNIPKKKKETTLTSQHVQHHCYSTTGLNKKKNSVTFTKHHLDQPTHTYLLDQPPQSSKDEIKLAVYYSHLHIHIYVPILFTPTQVVATQVIKTLSSYFSCRGGGGGGDKSSWQ